MKKDYIQDLLTGMIYRRKKRLEENEMMKRKHKSLSLVERNAFEELIIKHEWDINWIIFAPFYVVFYIGLFGLVMRYAFNIELLIPLKSFVIALLSLVPFFILTWLLFLFLSTIEPNKLKKKLLLGDMKCGKKI